MERTHAPRQEPGHQHRPLIRSEQIHAAIGSMARQICRHFGPDLQDLLTLTILEGARPFAVALLAHLDPAPENVAIQVKSYQNRHSTGRVQISGAEDLLLENRRVLILDDIYDTGRTLTALIQECRDRGTKEVKTAVLLEKQRPHESPVAVDFIGLQAPDEFLIGFGLDCNGQFRDLPYIAAL